jgi:predicted  nucleic acid-binding Zn-ribbon protein
MEEALDATSSAKTQLEHELQNQRVLALELQSKLDNSLLRIEALQTEAASLSDRLGASQRVGERLTEVRKAAFAEKLLMRERTQRLRDTVAALEMQIQAGAQRERGLESELAQARNAIAAQADRIERLVETETGLRARIVESDQQLLMHVEELCANAQAERAQLATLIDIVQSSHFWKIKRWFGALRRFGR